VSCTRTTRFQSRSQLVGVLNNGLFLFDSVPMCFRSGPHFRGPTRSYRYRRLLRNVSVKPEVPFRPSRGLPRGLLRDDPARQANRGSVGFHRDHLTMGKLAAFRLYACVNRTRATQTISKTSGSIVRIEYRLVLNKAGERCCPIPTFDSSRSGRLDGPRRKEPAAMNSPKHMRQRCRTTR